MFNDKYQASSIRLIFSWFTVCFIYYGIMILLPSILVEVFGSSKEDENFKYLFIVGVSAIEASGFFLASKIMDHPRIGRKKGVYYGLGITFAASLLLPFIGKNNAWALFAAFSTIKFFISVTFMVNSRLL